MKKVFLFFLALLALTACTSEFDKMLNGAGRAWVAGEEVVFYATIEDAGARDTLTKVYADEQMRVLWNADDRISLFNKKDANLQYRFNGEDGDNAGSFSLIGDNVAGNSLPHIYAVYPYSENNEIDNTGVITLSFPATQAYKENSFGPGANVMVSATDDNALRFKNLGGYLAVKLYGDNVSVSAITLTGNNGEKLAGNALVTATIGGEPTMELSNSVTNTLTLDCSPSVKIGSTAETATIFWFVVPPTTFTKGFSITVTGNDGSTFEKSTSNSLSIQRNLLSRMSPIEVSFESSPEQPDKKIGDIIDSDGLGVVVGVDGDECLIMSVAEAKGKTWPESNTWCTSYGEGWRMPTIEELTVIHGNFDIINESLVNNGYTTLPTLGDNRCHWSSTVNPSDSNYYYRERLADGSIFNKGLDEAITSTANNTRAIKIIPVGSAFIPISELRLSEASIEILAGEEYVLGVTVLPVEAIKRTLIWSSSDTCVAKVSNKGVVTGVARGTATIMVSAADGNGVSTSCEVTVHYGIKLNRTVLSMTIGEEEQFMAQVFLGNEDEIVWESSDTSIATVDDTGLVTAISEGITMITASSVEGEYSCSCSITVAAPGVFVLFEDANFKKHCVENFDTDDDGAISMSEAEAVTTIRVNTETITSLKGIECFTNLEQLTCSPAWKNAVYDYMHFSYINISTSSDNWGHWMLWNEDGKSVSGLLDTLDLSQNTALRELDCSGNQLKSLDVSANIRLTKLKCIGNQLTALDVSNCPELELLICFFNNLGSLNVLNCTKLTSLMCEFNLLTALDVSGCTELTYLDCGYNRIPTLDVSSNTALTYLSCGINLLTALDLSNNTVLTDLVCEINQLTSLDVSNNTLLTNLNCSHNQIVSLDMSNNTALKSLLCFDNQLTSLIVSNSTALWRLWCDINQLTSLDVSNNPQLSELECQSNPNLTEVWLKTNQTISTLYYDSNITTIKYKD